MSEEQNANSPVETLKRRIEYLDGAIERNREQVAFNEKSLSQCRDVIRQLEQDKIAFLEAIRVLGDVESRVAG